MGDIKCTFPNNVSESAHFPEITACEMKSEASESILLETPKEKPIHMLIGPNFSSANMIKGYLFSARFGYQLWLKAKDLMVVAGIERASFER